MAGPVFQVALMVAAFTLVRGALTGGLLPPLEGACTGGLALNNQSLKRISDGAFSNLTCLRQLDLSQNWLAAISGRTFGGLQRLLVLNLSHNALAVLWGGSLALPALRLLDVAFNRITHVESALFEQTPELQVFNASHNRLKVLPQCFEGLHELREVLLDHNGIAIFDAQVFSDNAALIRLDFAKNEMVILSMENVTFSWPRMRLLNLSRNCVATLNVAGARQLFAHTDGCLDLNDNHFTCTEWRRVGEGLAKGGVCVRPGRDWAAPHHIQGIICDKPWAHDSEPTPEPFSFKYIAIALALIGAAFALLLVHDYCRRAAPRDDAMDYVHLNV